jgi:hypothetical protein
MNRPLSNGKGFSIEKKALTERSGFFGPLNGQ